jgi:hypothetical protein
LADDHRLVITEAAKNDVRRRKLAMLVHPYLSLDILGGNLLEEFAPPAWTLVRW